jgi:segregation and condensation protein B
MGNESEEALAELPEMTATDENQLDRDASRDDDEGPSAEVLAEAAAAERDAAARKAQPAEVADDDSAGDEDQAETAVDPAAEATEGAEAQAAPEGAPAEGAEGVAEAEEVVEEGPGALLTDEELRRVICALLFASPEALSEERLAQLAEGAPKARVKAALTQLEAELAEGPFPLELRKLAGGWRLMTAAEMSEVVARLFQARKADRLSAAGLETLSVVAYRQPVTKAEIEAIRGVQCGPMLRMLVDRGLVKVTGRAELPGSPLQYGTTKDFLDRFGLGGLDELPRDGELLG